MARISELHYSNAYARNSGIAEFLEVALGNNEAPEDFTVSFYQANGTVGFEITLDTPGVRVTVDPDNGETVYVISADTFPIQLTDPDGGSANNYEAFALTNTSTVPGTVIDFYDIGGGTQNITALDGVAAGAVSTNLPVLVGPNSTTTTLQFNQPNPTTLTYDTIGAGDTGIACFVAGTPVDTPDGPRPIETLQPGDPVCTRDGGVQTLRWVGGAWVDGTGANTPIAFEPGALGATARVEVSPQHRVLVTGWQAELLFGQDEVLVPAKALVNGDSVRAAPRARVRYVHLLFDAHHIVTTCGLASESLFAAATEAGAVAALEEARAMIPDLARLSPPDHTARPCTTVAEGRVLQPA
ncbi:Hint domain-containing protein [Pseudaestuariivita atlantica]|uniref:Type I secretion protein n=1 Tax=Pseudaestuariivita atlantica TaxID=1317121 RepID=A0A0L1JRG3_9RHOB|nr:Hint domain-containing protein [Pseudaestuariivita atlantica]KNG94307.1 type I secretion protein [Pseudaestuariivita atlantica]